MRNATGIHYYQNGDFYDGEWINDRRTGRGRIFFKGGLKLAGIFSDDKAEGTAEFEDQYGNVFQTESEELAKSPDKKPRSKKSSMLTTPKDIG